jgi:hypothetical protein
MLSGVIYGVQDALVQQSVRNHDALYVCAQLSAAPICSNDEVTISSVLPKTCHAVATGSYTLCNVHYQPTCANTPIHLLYLRQAQALQTPAPCPLGRSPGLPPR